MNPSPDSHAATTPRWPFGYNVQEIVRPWLESREKWQDIYDRSLPTSRSAHEAREHLDEIDRQLARLSGRP